MYRLIVLVKSGFRKHGAKFFKAYWLTLQSARKLAQNPHVSAGKWTIFFQILSTPKVILSSTQKMKATSYSLLGPIIDSVDHKILFKSYAGALLPKRNPPPRPLKFKKVELIDIKLG